MKSLGWWVIAALVCGCGSSGGTEGAGGGGHAGAGGAGGTGGTMTTGAGAGGGGGGAGGAGGTAGSGGAGGAGGGAVACDPVPGAAFGSLPTVGEPTKDPPPAQHADLNMKVRGWEPVGFELGLVDYGGDTDALAPKLGSLYTEDHTPAFVQNFAVHQWDWGAGMAGGPIADWPVTLTAFAAAPGEVLEVPHSGYDIGQGKTARLLYLDEDSVTLKYTGEDNVVFGYTIHVVGVCVDPALRALYEANDAAGRAELPALAGDQPFGRAIGDRVLVAVRDTGAFMDPRSKKDWW